MISVRVSVTNISITRAGNPLESYNLYNSNIFDIYKLNIEQKYPIKNKYV